MQKCSFTGRKHMIYTQPNKGTFKIAIAGSTVTGKSIAENLVYVCINDSEPSVCKRNNK